MFFEGDNPVDVLDLDEESKMIFVLDVLRRAGLLGKYKKMVGPRIPLKKKEPPSEPQT